VEGHTNWLEWIDERGLDIDDDIFIEVLCLEGDCFF
jgi:hypothetical protein